MVPAKFSVVSVACVVLLAVGMVTAAAAQGGDASLRGTIADDQGGALPGVTVTATSPALLTPSVVVSDGTGQYRLINLPPGTYILTAELAGFAVFRREGILVRAGATFQVDIQMALGSLAETITVAGDAPMIEVSRPSNVLNIDGDFQRQIPLVEGKFWIDFLQMTPGVLSRPQADGSGRQIYFGNATDQGDTYVDMEGMMALNYNDTTTNRTGLSTEAVEDTQVKTGGVDAASPMGYGLVINMISKSGGNRIQGTAGHTFQPYRWNAQNLGAGTPATRSINQADFSLGGPILRDRAWFFSAARWQKNLTTPGRNAEQIARLQALFPGQTLDDTSVESFQPWLKVTTKLGANHTLAGVYQTDRLDLVTVYQQAVKADEVGSMGGGLYGAKLTSVWGQRVTTTFVASYNNKGGNNRDSYNGRLIPGPAISVHQNAVLQQGILVGSGEIARAGGNRSVGLTGAGMLFDTASVRTLRGDLTWFKDRFGGSHEFQVGFLAMPSNQYNRTIEYLNDGFIVEDQRLKDPNNASAGTVPFHRQYVTSGLTLVAANGRDRDLGFYVQDMWRPTSRLTATLGVRLDLVKRFNVLRHKELESDAAVGPRVGFSYLLTSNAMNVLRGTATRTHESMQGGRHGVASWGGTDAASFRDTYDLNGDGIFETVFDTPAVPAAFSDYLFDDNLSQPIMDEYVLGYRRQFPGQVAIDVAGITRVIHNMWGQTDINGFYPDGPYKPFGGFGRVDPNQGIIYQVTNNDWSQIYYRALQITMTKNLSHRFQGLVSLHRQWQHVSGTWNPTDPARFVEPDAFANNRLLGRSRGFSDQTSLPGGTTSPMWNPYAVRMSGTWHAPADVLVSGTYSLIAGQYSGAIVEQLAANDPSVLLFGPATVVSSTGVRQSNPLATRIRFVYPTQGEGQVLLPPAHNVGLKLAKTFKLGGTRDFQVAANILNLLNAGRGTEYARGGANRTYTPAVYLQPGNFQPPRSYQLDVMFRF